MAASSTLLVLLFIALLAMTSAQRDNDDDENSLEEPASSEGQVSHGQGGAIHSTLKEMTSRFQEELHQHGQKAMDNLKNGKRKLKKGKGRGGNQDSYGDILEGQDGQSANQQRGGQGGRGRNSQRGKNGQNARGGQKTHPGKGGKRSQRGQYNSNPVTNEK